MKMRKLGWHPKHDLFKQEKMSKTPPPEEYTPGAAFERLLTILNTLRTDCPWDKKQKMLSLRNLSIEEMYELDAAVLENDLHEITKELGDILLHLQFYAKIAAEKKDLNITNFLNS